MHSSPYREQAPGSKARVSSASLTVLPAKSPLPTPMGALGPQGAGGEQSLRHPLTLASKPALRLAVEHRPKRLLTGLLVGQAFV